MSTLATLVQLEFRGAPFDADPFQHAQIVVTNENTQRQWISQAVPFGPCNHSGCGALGSVYATTVLYTPQTSGYGYSSTTIVATLITDESTSAVVAQLSAFAASYDSTQSPYSFSSNNSNSYAAAAWSNLIGTVPSFPNINAPAWPKSLIKFRLTVTHFLSDQPKKEECYDENSPIPTNYNFWFFSFLLACGVCL